MKKTTLYMGLNDQETKHQEVDTLEAVKLATNIILDLADGCTIYNATGIYKHENGEIVIENTLRIELFEISEEQTAQIIATLKRTFNQESIIKQVETVVSSFE